MQPTLRSCFLAAALLLLGFPVCAQSPVPNAQAQEDFAVAVAKAHSHTGLISGDAQPFALEATAVSRLALHGTGTGTYKIRWVDSHHWQRIVSFPDFQQTELRNDTGNHWVEQSSEIVPFRINQLLEFASVYLPNSTTAANYTVTESSATGENGEAVTCYAATHPPIAKEYPQNFRWCFDTATGLVASEDLPIALHISFGDYVAFQGKQEYTKVHVTAGKLPVLDIAIKYSPLDAHALDSLAPSPSMQRSSTTTLSQNPEELQRPTAEFRYSPPLPPGTPDELKNLPVIVRFFVGTDAAILDASVEDAPNEAMAAAALDASRKYTFTPYLVAGKPVRDKFFQSIWFQNFSSGNLPVRSEELNRQGDTRGAATAMADNSDEPPKFYRNDELAFSFGYPHGFVMIPRGQLESDLRKARLPAVGLDPHSACNTILFKAQRLTQGTRIPEVITIVDLEPMCVFGALDHKALEMVAVNGAHSVVDQWIDHVYSKPREFRINDKTFVAVSASGIPHTTDLHSLNLLIVGTTLRGHVLMWQFDGPEDNLAEIARMCSVQIDGQERHPLLPAGAEP